MNRRQQVQRAAGAIALAAGGHQLLTGIGGVLGARPLIAKPTGQHPGWRNLDSELRFYAAWYATAGVIMRRAATDPRLDRSLAAILPLAWLTSGSSRVLSIRAVGKSAPLFSALMIGELGIAGFLWATRPKRLRSQHRASVPVSVLQTVCAPIAHLRDPERFLLKQNRRSESRGEWS